MSEKVESLGSDPLSERETDVVKFGKKKNAFRLNMEVCDRQNSLNEIKENGELSPRVELSKQYNDGAESKLKNSTDFMVPSYLRQPSECPLVENDVNKKCSTVVDITDFGSKDSAMSYETYTKEKMEGTNSTGCWLTQAFTLLVTLVTLGLVLFLFYKVSNMENAHVPEVIIGQSRHEAALDPDDRISGSFRLNQDYLSSYKKIQWSADEYSLIKPNTEEPCLVVPVGGKYLVVSKFTFKLPPGDDSTLLTHKLKLKSRTVLGSMKDTVFKRQYVSVIEHKLKEDSELRKPSVFIQFFDISAGDEICTDVSNPELLYISSIDNDVNIIKI